MEIVIKKLLAEDFRTALDLFISFQIDDGIKNPTASSDQYLINLLTRDDFHVIVAFNNEQVIGGLTAYELRKYKREETEIYIYELGVDEPFQRKGVATKLINYLKEICKEKKIDEMFVGALADNLPAIKLYESTGGNGQKVVEFTYELD